MTTTSYKDFQGLKSKSDSLNPIFYLIKRKYWHSLYLLFSDSSNMMKDQEKRDFITKFLEWKQEKDADKRQNCLLLSFGDHDLDYGLSQIR